MKLRNFFYIIFIGLLFNGCLSTPKALHKQNTQNTPPSWYLTPPNNDQEFLYGLGEATDISKAQQNALENLSQRVLVEISSSSEYTLESYTEFREYTSKSSKQNIKSVITPLVVTNYKILQSTKLLKDRYIVLISVEKSKIIDTLKNEINSLYDTIKLTKNNIKNKDILTRKYFFEDAINKLQSYNNKLTILKNLEIDFDTSSYLSFQKNLSKELEALKNSLSISIEVDEDSKPFISDIENFLIQQGFKLGSNNDPDHITLFLESSINQNNAYGINIIKAILSFKAFLKDIQIGGSSISFKAGSSNNVEDAEQNLIMKLQSILDKYDSKMLFGR